MTTLRIIHTEASCGWGGQDLRIIVESGGMLARGYQVRVVAAPESRIFADKNSWQAIVQFQRE
jgi:hypothetical protein